MDSFFIKVASTFAFLGQLAYCEAWPGAAGKGGYDSEICHRYVHKADKHLAATQILWRKMYA